MKKGLRISLKVLKISLIAIASMVAVLFTASAVLLKPSVLTSLVNRFAADYVDGSVRFGSINTSFIKSFPNFNLSIDDFVLTYPHDKFARYDSTGMPGRLRNAGRGTDTDTLATARNLSLSLTWTKLLSGRISFPSASLDAARIYAHMYDSTAANWDILKFLDSEKEDTASTEMPRIILRKIALTGRPRVVFTDPQDTVFLALRMKEARFDGRLNLARPERHRLGLEIDSLGVFGRLPADTVAFRLDRMSLRQKRRERTYTLDASARAMIASRLLGRMRLPMHLGTTVSFPEKDWKYISVNDFKATLATIDLTASGQARFRGDSTWLCLRAAIDKCPVGQTVNTFCSNIMPEALKLKTDAEVSAEASCDGWYVGSTGALPPFQARLAIPRSTLAYEGIKYKGVIEADVAASSKDGKVVDVEARNLDIRIAGAAMSGMASIKDLLGQNPLIQMDIKADASLDEFRELMPEGMTASGRVDGSLAGSIRMSDLDIYKFSRGDLRGYLRSGGLRFESPRDSISAILGRTDITIGKTAGSASAQESLAVSGKVDTLDATYGANTYIRAAGMAFTALNGISRKKAKEGDEINQLVGTISADRLSLRGEDSLFVGLRRSSNDFSYSDIVAGKKTNPKMSVTSRNGGIFLRTGTNRIGFRDASLSASAVKTGLKPRNTARRARRLDSLQKIYPGVPRDSLFRHARRQARGRELPDFLKDEQFRKKDIHLNLDESIKTYFREWTISCKLDIAKGFLATPYFPLQNRLSDISGAFNGDVLTLSGFKIKSGKSDIAATGSITGIRRTVLGRRRSRIGFNLSLKSDNLDANELLAAYDAGTKYVPASSSGALNENLSDDQYMAMVVKDSLVRDASAGSPLIVIPANLDARITLEGKHILYSNLDVNWFASDINVRQRCMQITNTVATSNMGDIYFEGFYASRTREDITAGFDLTLVDITADKVITLIPQVDSILPMLKTFKGMLDCEMAATTKLDTNMVFITPSINGMMKIDGSDLSIHDDGSFRKIARILRFKDKKVGKIKDMSVHGLITDNTLEIFPFVLSVDRYTLAMSGLQNFDQSFKYHVSVLKSPIPFRFGVNLSGNFDKWKYRLGKAKYKNTNVPVFTSQIDNMQVNLVNSIHNIFSKGVDVAVQQNAADRAAVQQQMKAAGYDAKSETADLTPEEKARLEEEEKKASGVVTALP